MFDIGFWELILISVIALVVLGPERLPVAIRTLTQFIRTAKGMANNVKTELEQELKIQELQDNLRKAEQLKADALSATQKSLNQSIQDPLTPEQATSKPSTSNISPPNLSTQDSSTKEEPQKETTNNDLNETPKSGAM